jgi:hypothetical protein
MAFPEVLRSLQQTRKYPALWYCIYLNIRLAGMVACFG